MKISKDFIYSSIILILFAFIVYFAESQERQKIKKRALLIDKECYTKADINIIIFGEPQS